MKLKEVSKNRNILSNASVFMAFLAFSFLSFSLVSPIVSSNADTNNTQINTGPYISSISVDSLTSINITPTSTQSVYTGTSAITYSNSCPYGFNVTMTSASENTSLTRYGEDSATKEIPSTTTTSLTDNTWGVSTNNGSTYSPIPSIAATPVNIINTFEATNNPATLNLIYGVKTDSSLPSGSYTNDLIYTVSAKPQCLTYGITWNLDGGTAATGVTYPAVLNFGSTTNLSTLTPTKPGYIFTGWSNGKQTFDGTETNANINPGNLPSITMTAQWEQVLPMQGFSCSTLTNVGDSVKLRDTRDNNVYTVKKLADGKCWMTENLRIAGKTITSADSNVTSDFTIPASSVSGFNAQNTNNAYVDSTYGGYYTFYTATAGTGGTSLATDGANAPSSICPKGWHLPTGGSTSEFNTLYGQYNSAALMMNIPNFTLSGVVGSGSVSNQGSYGSFWSSTVSNANRAYDLGLNSSSANPAYRSDKHYGFSVRFMADNSISDIIYMQDITPNIVAATATGTTATLTDIRDNNTYTVRKLKDGNVWMTQNLRIINKTISSADSNLPSGETWTIPASSISGFSTNNTNNAYLDSTYGGYYSFYTATAGWGTDSVASDNSPKDICPKGWRLPTGNSSGEFNTLYGQYNSAALMMDVPSFTLSGYVSNGSMYDQGSSGGFWSSTVYNANNAYRLYLNSSNVVPANRNYKYVGFSVRCMAQ